MDVSQQLIALEACSDWHGLAALLQKALAEEQDQERAAAYHLKLGRVLAGKLLQGALALRHFKQAWTLKPSSIVPLNDARQVYWSLGKFDTVQTLLSRTMEGADDATKAELLCELGDVSCDLGNHDAALGHFGEAALLGGPSADYAEARQVDLAVGDEGWQEHMASLIQQAHQAADPGDRGRLYLRAARVAMRFDAGAYEDLLRQAYGADADNVQATALFEEHMVAQGRVNAVLEAQKEIMEAAGDAGAPAMAHRFGVRWLTRHQNPDLGAGLLEQALQGDPQDDGAFAALCQLWGEQQEAWTRVLELCDKLAGSPDAPAYVLAEAGRVSWLKVGDLMMARVWFERLARAVPDHPSIDEFESQIGEPIARPGEAAPESAGEIVVEDTVEVSEEELAAQAAADAEEAELVVEEAEAAPEEAEEPAEAEVEAVAEEVEEPADEEPADEEPAEEEAAEEPADEEPAEEPAAEAAEEPAEEEPAEEEPEDEEPADEEPAEEEPAAEATEESAQEEPAEPEEPREQDDAAIAELIQKAEDQLQNRRNHDYVKTLVEIAEAYVSVPEKVDYFLKAAEVYQKFSNHSEASKCFESVFQADPTNEAALDYLRGYYEKRRDWESLINLLRSEADGQGDPDFRLAKYVEMAELATTRIKKPPICIALWAEVREQDPENPDALMNLATFYERSREWEQLADVLTEQAAMTVDERERLKMLEKLGQIQGDRLNNDEAAAEAWRQVLELNPGDRRAQEALKKKLLSLRRWDDLELLYEESGKWDEFIRLLESQESREKDSETKISMLLKVADLWETKKGKLDRAARAYEKILNIDEEHLGAAEALIPIYQEANNPKGLASSIEVKLRHVEDGDECLTLLREVAELYENKLRKPDLALERYLSGLKMAPYDEQCSIDVERVAAATKSWEALVNGYREALEKVDDPVSEGTLRLRLGRVLLEEMDMVDEALEQYRAVYDLDPENIAALQALEQLYRNTKRYAELLEVYEKQRDLAMDPEQQCRVLYGIAALYEGELDDRKSAIQTYWQVLEIEATDPNALEALDKLYLAEEDWEPYADVLRRRLETDVDEAQIIDLKYRLGQTLQMHLEDPAGALENYREILFIDPNNDAGRVALEGLLENVELAPEVAHILAEVYEGREEWDKLVGVLQILVDAEEDVSDRVRLLRKIAIAASEQLGDLDRAFEAQARALRDMPDSQEVRLELEDYAERGKAYDKLAKVLGEIATDLPDPDLAREYWIRLAAIHEQLSQIDEAAACYGKVLDIDPSDAGALDAMEGLFNATERWEDLIGVVRRRIELADDDMERESLYAKMAAVYEDQLNNPDEAIAAYNEVLSFDEASMRALAALDGLYSRQEKWPELGENLESQLRLAESEEQEIQLMLRLAALQETKLDIVEAAIETYRQVLDRVPTDPHAIQALERLGTQPAFEVEIAEILGPLYRNAGDHVKLLGVYEVQVRTSEDPMRKVELLHEMAQLHEDAAGDLSAAFDTLARALAVDPAADYTQEGLYRLARATDRHADLARVYEDLAAQQEDVELGIRLYTISAQIYETELGLIDNAVAHYRKILELDAQHLDAAEALERIFHGTDRFEELSAILQQKAELLHDMEDQKIALLGAAQIEEEVLERAEQAVAVFQKVLDIDMEEMRAIDALVRLYVGMKKWPELLEMLGRKVELVFDADERKRIYYQIGAVHESELSDVRAAIDTYQRVLEIDPDDLEALGRLDILYQQAEDWPELLNVLQREADLAADPAESISYQYRIAELYDKRLDDVARAIELYAELLAQQSDHQPTLDALEAITKGDRDPVGAALVLEPIYEAMGESGRLVEVLEVQVRAAEDEYSKVELLHRVARLWEDMLDDPQSAFATWARAVAGDVSNEESLQEFERVANLVGRWVELAALYDEQLETLVEDPMRFTELGLRVARIYELQLEDYDKAIERYKKVLDVEPENAPAIESLDRLYEHTERWAELADILNREAELAAAPEDILQFRFRLGRVHLDYLQNVASAIDAFGEVIVDMPEHEGALAALEGLFHRGVEQQRIAEILEPHYENLGDFEKMVGVYEAILAHLTEPEERLSQYYRLAELHEDRLLAADGALAAYIRALQEYPTDDQSLDAVERLAELVEGGWEMLANAYADVLGAQEDVEIQKPIGKRLARVFEEQLGDIEKAVETYRYLLSVAPLEEECLEHLDRIYSSMEQFAELAEVLEQRVQTTEETFQLVEFCTRLGEIYEEQLGQFDDAVRVYRRIFDDLEPENEQAQVVLERIYAAQEKWPELLGVYERQMAQAPGDYEQAEVGAKMGRVLGEHLNQVERAIDTWKQVLELRGDDSEALGALAELYERTEQWAELTEVLERHMGLVMDDEEQVNVLLRRARLFTNQLSRDDAALDDYNQVLDIDYANFEALYAINEIYRRREQTLELIDALHQTIDRAADQLPAEHVVALCFEVATLHEQQPDQSYEAIDSWRKLLEVDPRHFDAMASLENLLRADNRWEEVVEVKMMRARAFEEAAEQVREYLEVAEIWSYQIENEDGGTPALEAVLQIEARHDHAFKTLEKLHNANGRSEALVELYLARLDTADEIPERTDLLRRIATVFDEQIGDQNQAFDALLTALEIDFTDENTVALLEKMAHATKRWPELLQLVNHWLENQDEAPLQIALCLNLAKWYGEELGRADYAQPYYQKVLSLDPDNVGVLRSMANFHKKNARWKEQGQMLTKALEVSSDGQERAAILTDIGEVLEKHLEQPDKGLVNYQRALTEQALYLPAIVQLERIYDERQMTPELVEILASKAKALEDPEEVSATKLRRAGLLETTLAQPDGASEEYREVLELDAGNVLAMRGLERVYNAQEKWPDLLEVLEMHLDVAATERERIEVLMNIASLQEEHFLKPDLAAQRLEQVVEIDPANETAYESLARCYHRLRQWLDLIGAYERHINATDERDKKVQLFTEIAETYADEVQDQERALDAYLNIVDLDPDHVPALDALAKLYEAMDDPANSIDYMSRVAELTVDGTQRVEAYYKIGQQLEEKLGDRFQARERFEHALDLDPNHVPTLAALRAIAIDEAEWELAARYLDTEQQNTELAGKRAKLLVELGRLRDEMLEQHEGAIEAYQLALQADDDNEDAALPLAREYATLERWEEAEPLAELLVRNANKREREEQLELYMLYARITQALGKYDTSLKQYQAAHKIDLTNQEAVRGLADVNFALEDWAGALTNYQKVLTSFGEEDAEARAEVYYKLGLVKKAQGQNKQAINNYEKGLALDSAHRPTLQALVDIYEEMNDWSQAAVYRQQIIDNVLDGDERYELFLELGDIYADKVGDPVQAVNAFEEASQLKPDDHVLLHKMLQLYQKTSQWEEVVHCLQRIAEADPKPERRSRYLFTMAQAYRDKLNDPYHAAELFDEALDLNPEYLEAFKRIDKIFTSLKDWAKLERAYRKMIHRLVGRGKTDVEFSLWHALGLIYRDRLQDGDKAINAFTAAAQIRPDNTEELLILADLAEQMGNSDEALNQYHRVLKIDPMNVDTYRAIYTLFLQQESYDEAWCCAAVLTFLNRANEEEQRFCEDWRPTDIPKVSARLNTELWWNHLFHEEEDKYIGKIFESVALAALKAKLQALKAKNELPVLPDQFRQDPASSTISFARTFWWAGEVLGIRPPVLYARSDVPGGLVAVPAEPPSSIAGQGVLSGLSALERAFVAGKHLTMYRGEHYIKTLFPTITELTVLLFAAIQMVSPETACPKEIQPQVKATAESLAKFMQPMQREQLKVVVSKFLKEGARANIKRWMQTVETTAARSGLLLCGDLDVAKKVIQAQAQIPGDISAGERVRELMVYFVSPDHFSLRRTLGITIQTDA
ncbi:MAG: tetratricopeptide repeat protein [Deltaproteobacteria bacterium]|jgi:tetratricopeptide (TPR) repeat protein|nr:tetratricopeptide repeat protein [Deltaproteobacteria bacterium]MBW2532454.1 tetratricopeptide repeat protein [Deltaproteobacteria bacterium]